MGLGPGNDSRQIGILTIRHRSIVALLLDILPLGSLLLPLFLERLLAPLEKLLLRIARFGLEQPSEAWAAAWQTRWQYPVADGEFRRHEALASFGRVYLVHLLLGGVFWAWMLFKTGKTGLAVGVLLIGILAALVSYRLWRQHTFLILRLVQITAAWKRDKALP